MTQSYKQILKQIEALQRQAEKLRNEETEGVVGRIKLAITHYGLTAEQLGFGPGSGDGKLQTSRTKSASKTVKSAKKYADGQENEWVGRGPRPHWLRDALAAGKTLGGFATGSTSTEASGRVTIPVKKRNAEVSYRDQGGNTWSGMGPKPRWLKEALSAGATLDQFVS